MDNCPQCGEQTEQFFEGYCEECRDQNQAELDEYNARYEIWQRLSDEDRNVLIMQAMCSAS